MNKKKYYFLKDAGISLIVLVLLGTSIIITTAEYDEDQNIIFEQNIPDPSNPIWEWLSDTSIMSPHIEPNFIFEDFFDVQHPIHEIIWWGNEYSGDFPNLVPDDHEDMTFDIIFYEDYNGEPDLDTVLFSYTDVIPEITDTGLSYLRTGGSDDIYVNLYQFKISQLTPPCTLSDGWISIRGVDGDDCWFFWQESLEANNKFYYGSDKYNFIPWSGDFSLIFKTAVPETITFDGPKSGIIGEEQNYTIIADGYPDYDMYYYIDWGDGDVDEWIGPHPSGKEINVTHIWEIEGNHTIKVKAKNSLDMETDYITMEISIIKSKDYNYPFLNFLKNHPYLFPILRLILRL
jgi:hypothetical protein